jgi:molybdopterin-biosynthesis enzyme MoeA-like protein
MNANVFCNQCHRIPSECGCSGALNAYELAKKLEWYTNYDEFVEAGAMLRQQADRIAELEKENRAMAEVLKGCDYVAEEANTDGMSLNSMAHPETEGPPSHKVFNSVIDRNSLTRFKPLYTTQQIKELSDEEIEEVMYKCDWAYDPVAFARAILKKASEK